MATPIGHGLAGYAVYELCARSQEKTRKGLFFCLFMAIAADLDFAPGLVLGNPNLYHQTITHSIAFSLAAGLVAAFILAPQGDGFSKTFKLGVVCYLSHLVIDFFAPDGRPPYGEPLFWPIISEYFKSPVSVFLGVRHAASTQASTVEWLGGIFSLYNVLAIAVEVMLIGPFVLLAKGYRRLFLETHRS